MTGIMKLAGFVSFALVNIYAGTIMAKKTYEDAAKKGDLVIENGKIVWLNKEEK